MGYLVFAREFCGSVSDHQQKAPITGTMAQNRNALA